MIREGRQFAGPPRCYPRVGTFAKPRGGRETEQWSPKKRNRQDLQHAGDRGEPASNASGHDQLKRAGGLILGDGQMSFSEARARDELKCAQPVQTLEPADPISAEAARVVPYHDTASPDNIQEQHD